MKRSKPTSKESHYIIFTGSENDEHIFESLKAGATGYLLKSSNTEEIISAIREVHEGGSPMSSLIARKVIQAFNIPKTSEAWELLSPREREILLMLSKGLRYKEISAKLFVSLETIRTHIRNIYQKLEVQSRTEALNKIYGS